MKEVIVIESPNKVHSVKDYQKGSTVLATKGHFKDLPNSDIGVDLKTYAPNFVLNSPEAKAMLTRLKAECAGAKVYIASDPDREGYAIARMVYDEIKPIAGEIYRAEFHEITESGIKKGINTAVPFEKTNHDEYNAFLGRRIGDRMIGWIMSPKAKKSIPEFASNPKEKVSVGRVQSSAVRMIVEREKEILAFLALPEDQRRHFRMECVVEIDGEQIKFVNKNEYTSASEVQAEIARVGVISSARVVDVKVDTSTEEAPAPYMTSDLVANMEIKLKITSKEIMGTAQKLFESGLITYMRSDSLRLSEEFISSASLITPKISPNGIGAEIRYKSKNKNATAQEGHEAIRMSNDIVEAMINSSNPKQVLEEIKAEKKLTQIESRMLDYICSRTMASQCVFAEKENTKITIDVSGVLFEASRSVLKRKGWKEIEEYFLGEVHECKKSIKVSTGDFLSPEKIEPGEVKKDAPKRYSEGALTKELEKKGIGRPSTFVSYIETIKGREYVVIDKKRRLAPTDKAFKLIEYLLANHRWLIEYDFTAHMEDFLDKIQNGEKTYQDFCKVLHEKMGFEMPAAASPPNQKQIDLANSLSARISSPVPAFALKTSFALSKWIDESIKKAAKLPPQASGLAPSPEQLSFAKKIADSAGIEIPPDVLADRALIRHFIDKNMKSSKNEKGKGNKPGGSKLTQPGKEGASYSRGEQQSNAQSASKLADTRPPTEKMLKWAQSIAEKRGVEISSEILGSMALLSKWIDENNRR